MVEADDESLIAKTSQFWAFLNTISFTATTSKLEHLTCAITQHRFFNALKLTCGMMVIRERRSCSPILIISMPSISMLPPAGSMMRNKDNAIDDLPAPVRPTMPI